MQTYYILGYTQVIEIVGEEVTQKVNGRNKRVIKTESGSCHCGRYYNNREKAIDALVRVLEGRRATRKKELQQAQACFNEIDKYIKHWKEHLQQLNKVKQNG